MGVVVCKCGCIWVLCFQVKRRRRDPSPKGSDENDVEMKVLKRRKVDSPAV